MIVQQDLSGAILRPRPICQQKDRRGIGGSNKENGIRLGHAQPFIEEVDGKYDGHIPGVECLQDRAAFGEGSTGGESVAGDSAASEVVREVTGLQDARAKG